MIKCPKCERVHTLTFKWTKACEGAWGSYMRNICNEDFESWFEYWYPELPESLDVACECGFCWRRSEEFLFNTPDPPEKTSSTDILIKRKVMNPNYKPQAKAPPPKKNKKRWPWSWGGGR